MFTQKISMDCTKKQYEKYLKDELLKMGYKGEPFSYFYNTECQHICNNHNGKIQYLGSISVSSIKDYARTYLGSFNAPLFLALVAMTDSPTGNYGEYYTDSIGLVKINSIADLGHALGLFRKATKEEIMAKFRKEEFIDSDTSLTEKAAIVLLKGLGYKITKEF